MKASPQKKQSLEKYIKSKSDLASRPSLQIGVFSNQHTILNELFHQQSKVGQNKKPYKTTCEFSTYRQTSPNSKLKPFHSKYHFSSQAQFTKGDHSNIQKEKDNNQEQSSDLGELSIRLKSQEDEELNKVLIKLKSIGTKINQSKITQINQHILQQWYKELNENCQLLLKTIPSTQKRNQTKSTHNDNTLILQKQLAEEKKNRLLVEEQTSKIIQNQEAQIKQYIETIKQLEKKLLNQN